MNISLYGSFIWTSTGLLIEVLILVDCRIRHSAFVEVECFSDKNLEQYQAKWRNFYQASGGRMLVVCVNCFCMRNIRSEINYCLGINTLVVSLTNLADLQAGNRGEGDSVWLEARNRG